MQSVCLALFHVLLLVSSLNMIDDLDHLSLEGHVTDPAGESIAGARITVRKIGASIERSTTTDSSGHYRLTSLNPGVYQLLAVASGFRTAINEGISGPAGTTIRRDLQLMPGPIEAAVTIESTPTTNDLDTSRTVIGNTLNKTQIDELPTFDRNVLELLLTLPGVIEPALDTATLAEGDDRENFRDTPEEAGIFGLNGGTPFSNNLTIEGFDNNDDRAARERFIPGVDATEEVQVIANQFAAEYGRASGGRVNLRLRSGSEQLRGRAFAYFRDARLNANSFFRNADPKRSFRLPFTELNPGVTLGGPVLLRRLFFFAAYENRHALDNAEIAALVPAERNPDYPLPQPNGPNLGSIAKDRQGNTVIVNEGAAVALYDLTVSTPRVAHSFQTRTDFTAAARHSGFVLLTLFRDRDERSFPGGRRTLETKRASGRNSFSLAVSDSFVISDRMISETRIQHSRLEPRDTTRSSQPVVLIDIDDPRDVRGLLNPLTRRGTLLAGSSNITGTQRTENRLQIQQVFTLIHRRHQIRSGIDIQMIRSKYVDLTDSTGTFTFASPADFLMSQPARYQHRFETESSLDNRYTGIFVQDDWRPRPNLLLSAGIRWDQETILTDRNNVGPRLAMAWDPRSDSRIVVRAGFGLFYNRALLRTLDDFTLTSQSILIDTNLPQARSLLTTLEFPKVLDSSDSRVREMGIRETRFLRKLERGFRIPESYQAGAGVEFSIGRASRFEVNYVFSRGAHLWRESSANAPQLPPGFKDFTAYLLSKDFDNRVDPATGLRPISATGNADQVRFEMSQTSSRVAEVAGRRTVIFGLETQSTSNASSALRAALATLRPLRPDPDLEQVEVLQARGNSFYHGMTATFETNAEKGRVLVGYTLSRLIDDGVVNTSSPLVAGDFVRERALSLLDARHRFLANGFWRLPRWLGALAIGGTLAVNSPRPFNIGINGNDRNLDDVSNDRPNYDRPDKVIGWRRSEAPPDTELIDRFSLPPIGSSGNLKRNVGRGPWQYSASLRLSKLFEISETRRVTPQIEVFNPLNSTVFSFGAEFVDYTPAGAADFLSPRRTLRPRSLRIGLRFDF